MIKEGFILRKMPGMNLVLPAGSQVKDFNGALMLNDTGAFIFCALQDGKTVEQIAQDLVSDYEVSLDKARADILKTIEALKESGVMEED